MHSINMTTIQWPFEPDTNTFFYEEWELQGTHSNKLREDKELK